MELMHFTKDNFDQEVLNSDKPVLVDFSAVWCGPCRMVAPILEEIAAEREDVKIGKVDVDADPELAIRYGVTSIPYLMVVSGGQVINSALGARPKDAILKLLP